MVIAGKHDDTDSAEDALVLEEVDEHEYEGRIGGFLSERCTVYLRFYPDGTLDGHVRQRKKPTMTGLVLLSTSRKRKLPVHSDHGTPSSDTPLDSVLCAFIQGRWMRRGDGHVCHFKATKRQDHEDRQTLTCRAELQKNGTATGTWQLSAEARMAGKIKSAAIKIKNESEDDDNHDSEDDDETEDEMIQNVFDWRRVDRTTSEHSSSIELKASRPKDPLALYPLTPGMYQFRGFTTYTTPAETQTQTRPQRKRKLIVTPPPPRDECFVSMELLPDGTLKGKSREVAYPQSCPIKGTWEIGRVRYVLEYKVREAVGFFKYSGRVATPHTSGDSDAIHAKPADETRARSLGGKWRNVDDGPSVTPGYAGGRGHFELTCVHRSASSQSATPPNQDDESKALGASPDGGMNGGQEEDDGDDAVILLGAIRVLTTGSYVLKGMAIDEDGYEYESQLEIELLADGSVRGVCRELVFQQIQRLRGNWTRTTLQYELEYVVKREVGIYWYEGKLDSDGLVVHGAWCNQELLLENKMDPHANYRGEKGTFSYAILEATRRWSHTSHRDFPRMFRDRVRCVLLCSQRTHVLPSALWPRIFAFCGQEWFHVEPSVVPFQMKQEQKDH